MTFSEMSQLFGNVPLSESQDHGVPSLPLRMAAGLLSQKSL